MVINRDELPESSAIKATCVLVGAEDPENSYGFVEDMNWVIGWQPGMGIVVGQWERYPSDGIIRIHLMDGTKALQDRAIISLAKILEDEKKNGKIKRQRSTTPKPKKTTVPIPEAPSQPDVVAGFNSLREKLASLKKKNAIQEEHNDHLVGQQADLQNQGT